METVVVAVCIVTVVEVMSAGKDVWGIETLIVRASTLYSMDEIAWFAILKMQRKHIGGFPRIR